MTTAFFDAADLPAPASPTAVRRAPLDGGLRALLARRDDRLLRDIGRSRDDILGPEDIARDQWRRNREIWNL